MRAKFSVLMSIYKKEKKEYLELAIDSIYNQTLLPDEVVLVEDGILPNELENTVKKIEKKYNNLKVLRFKENRGLGPALNDGLRACKYEYIARMDTDDMCKCNRFEKQMDYLINNPDVDVVGSNMDEYDSDMNSIISKKIVPKEHAEIKRYIKKRNPMNHPTVIYRKSKVLKSNGYEDYPYFEDYFLWAKMIKNGCIFHNIQDELYDFRAGSSMIKRRGGRNYLHCIKKLERGLLDLNIINKKEYYSNLFVRGVIALIPNKIRELLYRKMLRK